MVDESVNIEASFPVPARGVPIICPLRMDGHFSVPLVYFGRETRASNRELPESPEPFVENTQSSSQRLSRNPLNSIIHKWEAAFALQGGAFESGEYVSSNGRGDDRYYHADDWLDNGGEEDGGENEEYFGEVDIEGFRAISGKEADIEMEADDLEVSEDNTDEEDGEEVDDAGGNWQILVRRLDSIRQSVIKDLVTELETFQAFPGHTKQKKSKSLRESAARLRRLLPKVNQLQTQWQAAVWAVVSAVNDSVTMQQFIEMWNDVAANRQKDEIFRERAELVTKLCGGNLIEDLSSAWQRGEAIQRNKHELIFNTLVRLWELWVQEEECAGRITPEVVAGKVFSKVEKRFASNHLSDLLTTPIPPEVLLIFMRIALVGGKRSSKSSVTNSEDEYYITLPVTLFVYRRNELLKCRLIDIKSLSSQSIFVTDKDWETENSSTGEVEFSSFESLFESYQQKFVRKQDRVILPSVLEAWKYFAIKQGAEYLILYDLAQRAATAAHFAFADKAGNPIFVPSIAAARSADIEKRKKQNDMKEERKRKREALEARAREVSKRNPPYNDSFFAFPEFNK